MDNLIYISAVGLTNIEQAQAVRANNLANVSTPGFRADLARVMSSEVVGDAYRTRVYGVNDGMGVDMQPGSAQATGRELDLAINGNGLFAVQMADGSEAYSRDGAMQVNALGQLTNAQGRPVMGVGGPIVLPPYENIVFGNDGTITIRPQGQGGEALVQIDQLKLVSPPAGGMQKQPQGYLVATDQQVLPPDPAVQVNSGFIESSNVNAIHELTEIMSLARQFEIEVKLLKNAEENDSAAAQLLRIG